MVKSEGETVEELNAVQGHSSAAENASGAGTGTVGWSQPSHLWLCILVVLQFDHGSCAFVHR